MHVFNVKCIYKFRMKNKKMLNLKYLCEYIYKIIKTTGLIIILLLLIC